MKIKLNLNALFYSVAGILTAIIGKTIHGSIFWAIMNFFFWWISWVKWLICKDVNISIIKESFDFFFK